MAETRDQDLGKGALEQEGRTDKTNTSMKGQLPHRTENPLLKSSDSDFPEPGGNPEHSGEPEARKKGNRKKHT